MLHEGAPSPPRPSHLLLLRLLPAVSPALDLQIAFRNPPQRSAPTGPRAGCTFHASAPCLAQGETFFVEIFKEASAARGSYRRPAEADPSFVQEPVRIGASLARFGRKAFATD